MTLKTPAQILTALWLIAITMPLASCAFVSAPIDSALSAAGLNGESSEVPSDWRRFHPPPPEPLSTLPPPEIELEPEVRAELQRLLSRERSFVKNSLARRQKYLPMMRQVFDDEGVPRELIELAFVESGYNPTAKSGAGAVGMWQFMRSTGGLYGLKIGWREDQRRDPVLSTIAAARHLRDLYLRFDNWELALAAYNAGVGGVTRALKRAGCDDFWTLARKGGITAQTKRFVPRVFAASLVARDFDRTGGTRIAASYTELLERLRDSRVARWSGDRSSPPS